MRIAQEKMSQQLGMEAQGTHCWEPGQSLDSIEDILHFSLKLMLLAWFPQMALSQHTTIQKMFHTHTPPISIWMWATHSKTFIQGFSVVLCGSTNIKGSALWAKNCSPPPPHSDTALYSGQYARNLIWHVCLPLNMWLWHKIEEK